MNNNVIAILRNNEKRISNQITKLRERLWYEEDINNIRKKLLQCEGAPLSQEQKKEINAYWKKLIGKEIPTYWHEYFYSRNGEFSVRYVPTCVYHSSLVYRLNMRPLTMAYTDKCSYDNYLSDVRRPETIIRNINGYYFDDKHSITKKEAIERCKNLKDVVIKPSMIGMWGTGVRIISTDNGRVDEKETVEELFDTFKENFIIQKKVVQHSEMSRLNPTSLNTLRVLSYHHADEVVVLYTVVRIGRKDKLVDNETAGGINADICLKDGHIKDCAYGTPSEKRILTTDVGTVLKGFEIPSFNDVLATVKELHKRLPYFNLIGWDFGVDDTGKPVLIEWNRCPDLSQTAHGPAFGDMTEEIVKFAMSQRDTFNIRLWNG